MAFKLRSDLMDTLWNGDRFPWNSHYGMYDTTIPLFVRGGKVFRTNSLTFSSGSMEHGVNFKAFSQHTFLTFFDELKATFLLRDSMSMPAASLSPTATQHNEP